MTDEKHSVSSLTLFFHMYLFGFSHLFIFLLTFLTCLFIFILSFFRSFFLHSFLLICVLSFFLSFFSFIFRSFFLSCVFFPPLFQSSSLICLLFIHVYSFLYSFFLHYLLLSGLFFLTYSFPPPPFIHSSFHLFLLTGIFSYFPNYILPSFHSFSFICWLFSSSLPSVSSLSLSLRFSLCRTHDPRLNFGPHFSLMYIKTACECEQNFFFYQAESSLGKHLWIGRSSSLHFFTQ